MEPHDQDHDWERLARYLAGESSAGERAAVDAWLAEDPERRELLVTLKTGWDAAGRPPGPAANVDAAWARMSASMTTAARARRYVPLLRAAAVIIIATGSVWLWRTTRTGVSPTPSLVAARTFSTKPGERRTITLEDSTEVILGVATRLEVAAGYGAWSRDMTLDGEALFRVRHDAQRPFRVRAGRAVTEDLGTEFTVRAYAGSDSVRVVVQSGSVSLKAARDSTRAVVRPGEMATMSGTGGPVVSKALNVDALVAFSRGQLVFDNTPMQRVAEELARWYDVDVKLASPELAGRHVTVTFAGESIDEVLRTIALSIGARVEHTGRDVTFTAISKP